MQGLCFLHMKSRFGDTLGQDVKDAQSQIIVSKEYLIP